MDFSRKEIEQLINRLVPLDEHFEVLPSFWNKFPVDVAEDKIHWLDEFLEFLLSIPDEMAFSLFGRVAKYLLTEELRQSST